MATIENDDPLAVRPLAMDDVVARALAAEQQARERTERLLQVTEALGEVLALEDAAKVIIENVVVALRAQAGAIVSVSADGQSVDLVHSAGYVGDPRNRWTSIPIAAELPLTQAARTGELVVVESREALAARFPALYPVQLQSDTQSWAAIPLLVGDAVVGVLGLSFARPNALLPDDVAMVLAMARQCAHAWERTRLMTLERQARMDAVAANHAKTQFLTNMSHELRTPLNAIGGHAQLIELGVHGPVTPEQREALRRIERAQQHLLGLINDVLDFAKVDAGATRFVIAPVKLSDILAEVAPLIQPQLSAKGLRYRVEIEDAVTEVSADRDKLRQIVLNLLANAVKFTEARGLDGRAGEVWIDTFIDAARPQMVRLRVHDNGIGIAADKQETIFEPFTQVDSALTRAHEGTGLGLAISRELARGMQGDVTVVSELGTGSTFTVSLRRAPGPSAQKQLATG